MRLFKGLLLRGAVTDKEEGLQTDVKFGRLGHQKGPQLCTWVCMMGLGCFGGLPLTTDPVELNIKLIVEIMSLNGLFFYLRLV